MNSQQRLYVYFMAWGAILSLLVVQINLALANNLLIACIIIYVFYLSMCLTMPSGSEVDEWRKKHGKS